MKKYLMIHGHFYQPPRENPWTEVIELQPSAHPAHDWNERINSECYYPNGNSRILDATNRIVDIVNNYKNINFNIGPTLLSWLEQFAPVTYELMINADRESVARFNGHGCAIAQCYNHIIMPLANERDQRTQILWGIADFEYRFNRKPESIWLPETAINQVTLNLLTEYGFRFIVLSPYQAERIKPLGDEKAKWIDVSKGNIDIRRAYRCFAKDENGKKISDQFLDIFFYHGDISKSISFEHLLRNASQFADRIEAAFGDNNEDHLVSVGTDGETYGHHERFGDLGLAYLLNVEAPARGITPISFGAYLDAKKTTWEVELKPGPNGEGTAWSCAHGVGRWYRNCGCQTGGDYHWNQEWRDPLRDALDHLRDNLIALTDKEGEAIFHNVWQARDEYIQVVLNRSSERLEAFFEKHLQLPSEHEHRVKALQLMEVQRNAMLMYTSCGWFFTELSGIETVQIMKYAARAIQLANNFTTSPFEEFFIRKLKKAKSNIAKYQDGEWIYNNFVKPSVVTFAQVVNHYAICKLHDALDDDGQVYIYRVQDLDESAYQSDGKKVIFGKIQIISNITNEQAEYAYALIHSQKGEQLHCFVRELKDDGWNYEQSRDELLRTFKSEENVNINEHVKNVWKSEVFAIADMFYEERQRVVDTILDQQLKQTYSTYDKVFNENYSLMRMMERLGLPLPQELILPAKITLRRKISESVNKLRNEHAEIDFHDAIEAAQLADKLSLDLELRESAEIFQSLLEHEIVKLSQEFSLANVSRLEKLVLVADKLKLHLHQTPIQNPLFRILKEKVMPAIEKLIVGDTPQETYEIVNGVLRIAFRYNFNIKIYKDRLKPFEQQFSQDPDYWP